MAPACKKPFYIWEGLYGSFPDTDNTSVWDSERWINSQKNSLDIQDLKNLSKGKDISRHSLVNQYPLPQFISMLVAAGNEKQIEILDFGGGLGSSFLLCAGSLPDPGAIKFHIVDGERVCEAGRKAYAGFENIVFHDSLPQDASFDVVHTAAALHYIRDWKMLLKQLSGYRPGIMILNALNAGNIKTFASFQNYYDTKIPVWFFNIDEILAYVSSLGYRLIYKSLQEFSFLGKYGPLPMENFPPEYRLDRKCNLVFIKE